MLSIHPLLDSLDDCPWCSFLLIVLVVVIVFKQHLKSNQIIIIIIHLVINRRQADEVHLLETAIRQRSEQQRKAGAELDATCQLCLKTKFADGLGHACHYCNVRCCARCGGKVALRSSKVKIKPFASLLCSTSWLRCHNMSYERERVFF